jgi:hypothetical protein
VSVGRYQLEVGAPPGSLISWVAHPTDADLRPLALALQHGRDSRKSGGELADAVGDASDVTAKVEYAVGLLQSLAEGKLLDVEQ